MRAWLGAMMLGVSGTAWAGVTLNVDTMTVNGFEVHQLQCDVSSGGLFASAEIVAALSAQKPAFDACVPGGAAYQVNWQTSGGSVISSAVGNGSNDAKKACIGAALKQLKSTSGATCSAVILVGDPAVATSAAEALKAK